MRKSVRSRVVRRGERCLAFARESFNSYCCLQNEGCILVTVGGVVAWGGSRASLVQAYPRHAMPCSPPVMPCPRQCLPGGVGNVYWQVGFTVAACSLGILSPRLLTGSHALLHCSYHWRARVMPAVFVAYHYFIFRCCPSCQSGAHRAAYAFH